MATPIGEFAFVLGELSPSLFGSVDLARWHTAASTMRNMFPSYRRGAYSRAGTAFVGYSKQTGRGVPPRLIPFQFSINQGLVLEFGNFYMRVISNGAFVTESPINITGITNANPAVMTTASDAFVTGDWVFISGVGGMGQVNNQTYVLTRLSASHYSLHDVYGNNIDSTAFGVYTSGGTAARIFTLSTIYAEADLAYLKFTQSADVMSICCVNQQTNTEYIPQDLTRTSNTSWSFAPVVAAPSVSPPGSTSAFVSPPPSTNPPTPTATFYAYYVTSVNATDGTESIQSPRATAGPGVDIASVAGSVTVTWSGVNGVNRYNIYKCNPSNAELVPDNVLAGFCGSSYGTFFVDSNIVPDFSQVPPRHYNPFARGQITVVNVTAGGSGYTSIGYTITTSTGSGAVFQPTVNPNVGGGTVENWVVLDAGHGYQPGDTITVTGTGTGATATLSIGPNSGTYPSVPTYFQQRRVYANTLNNPDTYWMSQPGSFTNFDFRIPTIDTDSITGSPWAVQVNGIQFFVQIPSGLLAMTGLSAWLLAGAGSFATNVQPISPASQIANPQAFTGCSALVPPIRINYDVLYVNSKGNYYYDLPYTLYALNEPLDITQNSNHLFQGFNIREHAWCEQPNKLLWAVRNDGILLSLTWLKSEQVQGWAHHDTALGHFYSVCSVTEPPVDALYLATQRILPAGSSANIVPFVIERMDNRLWTSVENCWCVDCGLALQQQQVTNNFLLGLPATGFGTLAGFSNLVGGTGYSAGTTLTVVDDNGNGPGSGAVAVPTIVGGVITNITFTSAGSGYTYPSIFAVDPANSGSGFSVVVQLNQQYTFTASSPIFSALSVGNVIRIAGGVAIITNYVSTTQVNATLTHPITNPVFPDTPWTISTPVTTVTGLNHLAGLTVTGLADGIVIPSQVVSAQGTITLSTPASQVIVGLGFPAQLQSVYLDTGEPTTQGQRKKVATVTARLENSLSVTMGCNQVDWSTLSPVPVQFGPSWINMQTVPNLSRAPYNSSTVPLYTGDTQAIPVTAGFAKPGQVALQQLNPLPMQVLALIPNVLLGDVPEQSAKTIRQRAPQ